MAKSLLVSSSLIGRHFAQQPIVFSGITKSMTYFDIFLGVCSLATNWYNMVKRHWLVWQALMLQREEVQRERI